MVDFFCIFIVSNTKYEYLSFDFINLIKRMGRAIYEYTKTVLKKVSFNSDLFCKELEKALKRLLPHEINELSIWIKKYISNKPELYVCLTLIHE